MVSGAVGITRLDPARRKGIEELAVRCLGSEVAPRAGYSPARGHHPPVAHLAGSQASPALGENGEGEGRQGYRARNRAPHQPMLRD